MQLDALVVSEDQLESNGGHRRWKNTTSFCVGMTRYNLIEAASHSVRHLSQMLQPTKEVKVLAQIQERTGRERDKRNETEGYETSKKSTRRCPPRIKPDTQRETEKKDWRMTTLPWRRQQGGAIPGPLLA